MTSESDGLHINCLVSKGRLETLAHTRLDSKSLGGGERGGNLGFQALHRVRTVVPVQLYRTKGATHTPFLEWIS